MRYPTCPIVLHLTTNHARNISYRLRESTMPSCSQRREIAIRTTFDWLIWSFSESFASISHCAELRRNVVLFNGAMQQS
jgi:hypothetical protein